MDIEFDPGKSRENLRKHRVNLADAEQVLHDPMALTIEDPESKGGATLHNFGDGRNRDPSHGCVYFSGRKYSSYLGA
ncbi:BrnT family toxin [Desulfobulbus alkaliphilus]|nr:BrnT family toxin [Desulfobulbus alkaliphilus]MBM9535632.1 BrnT family toxin [Desulfobulbus alkaliphilus]